MIVTPSGSVNRDVVGGPEVDVAAVAGRGNRGDAFARDCIVEQSRAAVDHDLARIEQRAAFARHQLAAFFDRYRSGNVVIVGVHEIERTAIVNRDLAVVDEPVRAIDRQRAGD